MAKKEAELVADLQARQLAFLSDATKAQARKALEAHGILPEAAVFFEAVAEQSEEIYSFPTPRGLVTLEVPRNGGTASFELAPTPLQARGQRGRIIAAVRKLLKTEA